ncbi:MAG TPA: phosphoribosyl-AMP cyclohydrolase [Beijerinckiaceae bacterium]|jgi:phosphoribosyl-AMP cyclohydrolase|nr:phosphoribosyl-AMP cyclohydrolase [Beijerinckiaceae bacterium]
MTKLDFTKLDGLLPAIVQDATSHRVLMLGFMNEEAWRKTLDTGSVTFYSRSRNKLWMKGESSGNRLLVKEIFNDCDNDTLLITVDAIGPGVCHAGYESCFYRKLKSEEQGHAEWVENEKPTYDPNAVYGGKQ